MTSTTANPFKVFNSACSFRRAATLLKEAYKNGESELNYPLATNAAFAAELFMKCLLYLDAVIVPKTHSLKNVFCKLNKTHREQITNLFKEEVKKKPHISKLEAFEPNFKFEIDNVLEATANAFEEWRYIFEERECTVRFYGMEELVDALHA